MPQHARRRLTRRDALRKTAVGGLALAGTAAIAGPLVAGADAATPDFGYRDDGRAYVVGTGADLVFKVDRRTGDLTSLVYKGTEYQGYGGKNSHVETGLGTSSVSIRKTGDTILVTVVHGTMHHYYAARRGENNVYMWTNKADASITATRYIVRVRPGLFPNDAPDSWDARTDTLVEAQDIRRKPNGGTRSKHYSNQRVIDYDHVGWSTGEVGMWIVRSNHEKASGGPFYRSLMRHHYEDGAGLYEILYYGENQTEPMRFGLQGPYVLAFTDGSAPSPALRHDRVDTSWVDGLGLAGWVGRGGRGRVAGVGLSGRGTAYAYTVGFANTEAQYWTEADPATGRFVSPYMLPGTYTLTVYKEELAVHTTRVTVTAGRTTALHTLAIGSDPSRSRAIWRIGDWSGTPRGFKNATLMTTMHPSDARARPWTGSAHTVGVSHADDFPCYQWADINNRMRIRFKLTSQQLALGHTLNIGVTTAFANGRPRVRVNDWVSAVPAPTKEPSTRSLTVGSYRGNNHTYSYAVPASAWVRSPDAYQELTLDIVSGSGGSAYLSPGVSYDAIELLP
ncbi:rhamnogalacturonan lyase B N-terminal domain-containing protein [Streptomyces resistomycificus]|uniref:rhamnogalacturonan endolyase n=1 Tax=Streptomyces resistomycificus TaxID=67356 RepID=A0A0L8KY87_9ACTN|nr:rhamnogalacturonan lyase B N-terminal domain-containing protein [Streptomyces resistomycificus]KOG30805.1 rhamnogalacturonase B precursor [Streptomyces resistomycificus]KUN98171.1 rhamnogalacturonase B precursor [Streptomyces resistomycificus]